jgi:hypothetical protein
MDLAAAVAFAQVCATSPTLLSIQIRADDVHGVIAPRENAHLRTVVLVI